MNVDSVAVSPLTTCFAQGQNPWHSNLTVQNATAQDRSHGRRSAGRASVKSSEMILNDHFHSPITVAHPPLSLCLSPTTTIKFQFAGHQQGEFEFQSQAHLPPGIQLQLQGPTSPISSCPITQPASPTRTQPMIHTPFRTNMASEKLERINEHGFTTSVSIQLLSHLQGRKLIRR